MVALIDFEDATYGSMISDISTSVAHYMMDKEDPIFVAVHILKGYSRKRKILEEELNCLFDQIETVALINVVVGAYKFIVSPSNHYGFHYLNPSLKLLEQLDKIGRNEALKIFKNSIEN